MQTPRDPAAPAPTPGIRSGRKDVATFLTTPTNMLPDFPLSIAELNAATCTKSPAELEIMRTLGMMYLKGVLGDVLTMLYARDLGVVGCSSWIRDVLTSESTRAAIATRFNWTVSTSIMIPHAHIIYYMMACLNDGGVKERGEEDLERWAGEFFRPLAGVAKKTWEVLPEFKESRVGHVDVVNASYVGGEKPRPLAVSQMEAYLRRISEGKPIPRDSEWLEKHEVVQAMLRGEM